MKTKLLITAPLALLTAVFSAACALGVVETHGTVAGALAAGAAPWVVLIPLMGAVWVP